MELMDEWDWAFFYNEAQNNVESVTTFHQLDCDMGSLAEAHPEVIYFYARFAPLLEWDFNEVAPWPGLIEVDKEPPFQTGIDHASLFVEPEMTKLRSISLDKEPNAWGFTIHLVDCPAKDSNDPQDEACICRPTSTDDGSPPTTPDYKED